MDQFSQWREAIANGKRVEYTKGSPTAGYFKRRARNEDRSIRFDAVAIWQEDGEWFCQASAGYTPTKADEIEELFVNCNSSPITYELFEAIMAGGAWPEEVKTPEPGKADLPPHEAAAATLKVQQDAAKTWILTLKDAEGKNRKPATQEEADKASEARLPFVRLFDQTQKAVEDNPDFRDKIEALGTQLARDRRERGELRRERKRKGDNGAAEPPPDPPPYCEAPGDAHASDAELRSLIEE